jgi:hypothetical protein
VKQVASRSKAGFLPVLFFDPEDGGDILLRNVVSLSTNYTALYLTKQNPSFLDEVTGFFN